MGAVIYRRRVAVLLVAGLLGLDAAQARAQQTPPALLRFLRENIGLSANDIASIERGQPFAKSLDTEGKKDVAVFGIVTVDVPRDSYVRQLRDLQASLRQPTRLRFGVFGEPASVADLQALTMEDQDVAELRKCKPNDCNFKLPATEMRHMREDIGSSGDPRAELTAYARRRLVEYVNDYRARGDSAMVTYDDNGGVRANDAFAALLAQSPYMYQFVPALTRYLTVYPRERLDGVSEALYWSEDAPPHLRRTLSLTHQAIYTPPEFPAMTVIASKQIYATHYFEAALDLTSVIERDQPSGRAGSYVIVLRRYRFDNLPSGGILNIRGRVINNLRSNTVADLARAKQQAERLAGR